MPGYHFTFKRRRDQTFQREKDKIQDQVEAIEIHLTQTLRIKAVGGDPYLRQNVFGLFWYVAQSANPGRSHLELFTPMVSGQRFGHDASTGIAIADEKHALFHKALQQPEVARK
jgi:hypothetical protein